MGNEITNKVWELLAASVLGLLVYVSKSRYDKWQEKRESKKTQEVVNLYIPISNVFTAMSKIQKLEGIGIVSLVKYSNGGKKPKAGSTIYGQLIEPKIPDGFNGSTRESFLDTYSRFPIDEHYIDAINTAALSKKVLSFKTDELERCTLRTLLRTENYEGIKFIHIFCEDWDHYMLCIQATELSEQVEAEMITWAEYIRVNFKLSHRK